MPNYLTITPVQITHENNYRLTKKLDDYQSNEQAGFRKGYSTTDHFLTIKLMIEKCNEYQIPIYIAFVDYEKAFDTIETWAIERALQNCRIHSRYIQLIQEISNQATAIYHLHDRMNKVPLRRGVRQDDTLSPKLFTLTLEDVFKKLEWSEVKESTLTANT